MSNPNSVAPWILNSVLNAGGLLAAAHSWNTFYLKKYRRLLWLIPSVVLAAWLETVFGTSSMARAASTLQLPVLSKDAATNLLAYVSLGLLFLLIRRAVIKRKGHRYAQKIGANSGAIVDTSLRQSVESFLAAADQVDLDSIAATYSEDFLCVRVADEGGFTQLTREQMLSFLKRSTSGAVGGHSVPSKDSQVHHAEILGDTALVLVTRVKDLGKGWEPMFYTLVWKKRSDTWTLCREFVHQRTIPNWR